MHACSSGGQNHPQNSILSKPVTITLVELVPILASYKDEKGPSPKISSLIISLLLGEQQDPSYLTTGASDARYANMVILVLLLPVWSHKRECKFENPELLLFKEEYFSHYGKKH